LYQPESEEQYLALLDNGRLSLFLCNGKLLKTQIFPDEAFFVILETGVAKLPCSCNLIRFRCLKMLCPLKRRCKNLKDFESVIGDKDNLSQVNRDVTRKFK